MPRPMSANDPNDRAQQCPFFFGGKADIMPQRTALGAVNGCVIVQQHLMLPQTVLIVGVSGRHNPSPKARSVW